MVKIEYFYVVDREDRKKSLFELRSTEGDIEFWSDDDRVAFEEKIETAFRQCLGEGYEVVSVGSKCDVSVVKSLKGSPSTGFLRVAQIIGDKKRGIPAIIPVAKSTWFRWVAEGHAPKPVKVHPCTQGASMWRVEDILKFIDDCYER